MNKQRDTRPLVADLVQDLMPDASLYEKILATKNLRDYLAAVYRIFCRLEAEGKLHTIAEANKRLEEIQKKYEG